MMRKSIVFDKNTPDVFYCPVHKPTGFDKMIVKAKPLSRLCQFEGGPIPKDYKSDCYNDVDESEYACKEKYRIMVSVTRCFEILIMVYLPRSRCFFFNLSNRMSLLRKLYCAISPGDNYMYARIVNRV